MSTRARKRLSNWLFGLAIPVTLLVLVVGWSWEKSVSVAYLAGMSLALLAWVIAPVTETKTEGDRS